MAFQVGKITKNELADREGYYPVLPGRENNFMKIFYFTATGNSLYVAKSLGGELISMAKVLKSETREYSDDAIGFVFPCYMGSLPKPVIDFLDEVTLNADYIFGVTTYGLSHMAVGNQLKKKLNGKGMELDYFNQVMMVDNNVTFFEMEKQKQKHNNEEIEAKTAAVRADIESRRKTGVADGTLKRKTTKLGSKIYLKTTKKFHEKFMVEDACNACGTCAMVCPVNNITVDEKAKIGDKCVECLACTHNCPQNAIRVRGEKSRARYRNDNVSLQEIIEANS